MKLFEKLNEVKASVWFLTAIFICDALLIALILILSRYK